ncbi:hypothetical protein D3C78_1233010 [compost metagenome]
MRRHTVHFVQADDANLGVFQRHGRRHVLAFQHAVHADDFARQVETGDLDLAGGVFQLRLDAAKAHAIDGVKGMIQRIQHLAFFKAHALLHQLVQLFHFGGGHAHGHTHVTQHTRGTVGGIRGNGNPFLHTMTFIVPGAPGRRARVYKREDKIHCSRLLLRVSYGPRGAGRACR